MKKLLILSLAALVAVMALTGCQRPDTGSADPTKVPLSELNMTFSPNLPQDQAGDIGDIQQDVDVLNRPVFIERVTVPGGSTSGSYYKVITDYAEFKALLGSSASRLTTEITEDTFTYDFIVAIFTTVSTGGFSFNVDHAENDAHTVKVELSVTPPAAGTAVTQAFETHCVLVGFDAADLYDDLVYDVTVNGAAITDQPGNTAGK